MVALDHFIHHGLTTRLVTATFRVLTFSQIFRVEDSLRQGLSLSPSLPIDFGLQQEMRYRLINRHIRVGGDTD